MNVQATVKREIHHVMHDDIGPYAFATIVRRSLFWTPERMAPSPWLDHVPFAFWLIDVQRPRRMVELGTHSGVSYSAMCQAVKTLNTFTSCSAIDSWDDGGKAGLRQDAVYRDLAAFHEQRFGSFSQLIRSSFDDALCHFEDGSIDLLHIGGLRTCEAVRHDYQAWLPKLSANAVVLLHGINVREGKSGASRLWNETAADKPHFNFLHGCGLGVLGQGRDYPDALQFLFDARNDRCFAGSIRETFGALGHAVRALYERSRLEQALKDSAGEAGSLRQLLAAQEDKLTAAGRTAAEYVNEIGALRQTVNTRDSELVAARQDLAARSGEITTMKRAVDAHKGELAALRHALTEHIGEIQVLRNALDSGEAQIKRRDGVISELLASMSWRITAPMRVAKGLLTRTPPPTYLPLERAERRPPPDVTSVLPTSHSFRTHGVDPAVFDPAEYLELHPDVKAAGMDAAQHFITHGQAEGRLGRFPDLRALANIDRSRETVLVVCHDGSRTGAPILGYNLVRSFLKKYNVVALFLRPGPVIEACLAAGAVTLGPINQVAPGFVGRIIAAIELKFAVVNSIESRDVLQPLAQHFVPAIILAHEFASYTRPSHAFVAAAMWSGDMVFSTRITRDNAYAQHPELNERQFPVLAQGRCALPLQPPAAASETSVTVLAGAEDSVLIIGAGTIQYRKGVDLFIACAALVRKRRPDLRIRYVWIGDGYAPDTDASYSVYLADQISREGLRDHVSFVDAMPDLSPAYAAADIFLLSSRLDPLPNVTIDALYEGIPVVCFGLGNGLADTLSQNDLGDICVARGLDVGDMAEKVIALAASEELRNRVGRQCTLIAERAFNMDVYVASIEEVAAAAARRAEKEKADALTIEAATVARLDYFPPPEQFEYVTHPIRTYVRAWSSGIHRRKLFPGFHPGIYLAQRGIRDAETDPLADFLRNGRPKGPWLSQVITPADPQPPGPPACVRVALHIHAYYPDLLPEIIDAISVNHIRPDLLISVASEAARDEAIRVVDNYKKGAVHLRVVPNRGRDIGPFLTEFKDLILGGYDIVGHFHTKKSLDLANPAIATVWRRFLIENLLGGKAPMSDIIVGRIAADADIGLVFPDEPNVVGWGLNRPIAESIARRMALGSLPDYLNFPVGTMFWAAVPALNPLFKLDLDWSDYPEEPLPTDGSVLHSLERLLPLIAAAAGKKIVLTNVPGVTR